MKIINTNGRLGLVRPGGYVDVEEASNGEFGPDVASIYDRWDEFVEWAGAVDASSIVEVDPAGLGAPSPRPRQVFAIGLNYRDHAEEANMQIPTDSMVVFTKFASSITGPNDDIVHPGGSVDFETELVVIMGRKAFHVDRADAWSFVAGVTMGQDVSERELQLRPPSPQFGLGKSYPGFSPMGPCLVTPDEFADCDDIELGCRVNGEQMQKGRTGNMIFPVARVIEYLSAVLPLYPGDVIFTGTPAGVGVARDPARLLSVGDELVTHGVGIGEMHNRFVAPSD
ncbi:fumarylacetoacetate hydrolase family protein [Gordonia sp. TBRC 11910]|uniref:Fumarylacetoacetate hydrolase family protein n=1 Tax=Gordonia asplenii TaxID=2725283 RepID=A0A848KYB7_9ACTN|nr:fumarylacetoacetate hydrolase family protein [Gordonia asplenii]NMO03670.1 fumarylacetoacetate hydrolase family protein [Gordonia asplenii]